MNASLTDAIVRMALGLSALIGAIFLLAWLARRFGLGGAARGASEDTVRVLSRTALDPRKSVVLLSVRGRVLVVGVTPSEIRLLTELPGGEARPASDPAPFSSRLSRALADSGILPNAH